MGKTEKEAKYAKRYSKAKPLKCFIRTGGEGQKYLTCNKDIKQNAEKGKDEGVKKPKSKPKVLRKSTKKKEEPKRKLKIPKITITEAEESKKKKIAKKKEQTKQSEPKRKLKIPKITITEAEEPKKKKIAKKPKRKLKIPTITITEAEEPKKAKKVAKKAKVEAPKAQAKQTEPKKAPTPPKPKRKRRTKAEMEEARKGQMPLKLEKIMNKYFTKVIPLYKKYYEKNKDAPKKVKYDEKYALGLKLDTIMTDLGTEYKKAFKPKQRIEWNQTDEIRGIDPTSFYGEIEEKIKKLPRYKEWAEIEDKLEDIDLLL